MFWRGEGNFGLGNMLRENKFQDRTHVLAQRNMLRAEGTADSGI